MTLEQLRSRLQSYLDAEQRILQSQEYWIGTGGTSRRNRRADLESVQAEIRMLRVEIARIEAQQGGRRRVMYIR